MLIPTLTQVQEMWNKLAATMVKLADCQAELQMKDDMCGSYHDSYVNSSTQVIEVGGLIHDVTQRGRVCVCVCV
jgi:hypothetical protein